MTLAQTIVSDVVTLRERSVRFPSKRVTYLLTCAERGKYQGILVRSVHPSVSLCTDWQYRAPSLRFRTVSVQSSVRASARSIRNHGKSMQEALVVPGTDIGITRRWIFRLNLPLTAMSTVAVFYFMPLKPVEGSWLVKIKMVDFFGCALTLAASTLIVVSLCLKSEVTFDEQLS